MSIVGTRYRIVTRTGEEEHVSRVVFFAADEVQEALELEAELHEQAGWDVRRVLNGTGSVVGLVCESRGKSRTVSARAYTPLEDA